MIDPLNNIPTERIRSLRSFNPIKFYTVDNDTQGNWMGRYGTYGGIMFDSLSDDDGGIASVSVNSSSLFSITPCFDIET